MTDQTSEVGLETSRFRRPPKAEFYAYFAIVFAATLPLSCLTWALQAARQLSLPERGPISRAWTQARLITPMIFSAP